MNFSLNPRVTLGDFLGIKGALNLKGFELYEPPSKYPPYETHLPNGLLPMFGGCSQETDIANVTSGPGRGWSC